MSSHKVPCSRRDSSNVSIAHRTHIEALIVAAVITQGTLKQERFKKGFSSTQHSHWCSGSHCCPRTSLACSGGSRSWSSSNSSRGWPFRRTGAAPVWVPGRYDISQTQRWWVWLSNWFWISKSLIHERIREINNNHLIQLCEGGKQLLVFPYLTPSRIRQEKSVSALVIEMLNNW